MINCFLAGSVMHITYSLHVLMHDLKENQPNLLSLELTR